ncbi:S8 family serine peptidase [Guyparkeria sp.]|uniref:S8 family serine peptidase n=1 Tax=Guyparkeria sp. TaxID=2035736 RepID=UPI0039709D3B
MHTHPRFIFILFSATSVAALTACGGGSSSPPPETDFDTPAYYFDGNRATVERTADGEVAGSVNVAVIDSGIDTAHREFQGDNDVGDAIYSGGIDYTGDNAPGTDTDGHGTVVASIIAGRDIGYSGNATLSSYRLPLTDDGAAFYTSDVLRAAADAASSGDRVLNLSMDAVAVDPVSNYYAAQQSGDITSLGRFSVIDASRAVAVVAAGNASANVSVELDANTTWDRSNPMYTQTLIVGALDESEQRASYSNYAGENADVQERFLVAKGYQTAAMAGTGDGYAQVSGTSVATPEVSAALATLLAYWDFWTPEEAAQHLLNTADQTFANQNANPDDNYGDTSCGAGGTTDCGLYNFGQGKVDVAAALEPSGTPTVAVSSTVPDSDNPDSGAPIDETVMAVPAGLGDAGEKIAAALSDVQVFDDLGRNYTADLSGMVNRYVDPTQGLGFRMSQFLTAGLFDPMTSYRDEESGTVQTVGLDAGGRVALAGFGTDPDSHDVGMMVYHFGHGASAPDASGYTGMSMLSYAGNTPMADQIDSAYGMNVDVPLVGPLSLTSSYWQGEKRLSLSETDRPNRVSDIAVGLKAEIVDGVDLTAGYSRLTETAGFLGMTGAGGVSTQDGSDVGLMQLGLNAQVGGFNAFAHYQSGRAVAGLNHSVITDLNADVEQMAIGASYDFNEGRKRIAFVASEPLHLTGGEATMRLATGRTMDGQVTYRVDDIGFNGADAPRNYELGYRQRIGKKTLLGINVMRMENAANRLEAGADHGLVLLTSRRF